MVYGLTAFLFFSLANKKNKKKIPHLQLLKQFQHISSYTSLHSFVLPFPVVRRNLVHFPLSPSIPLITPAVNSQGSLLNYGSFFLGNVFSKEPAAVSWPYGKWKTQTACIIYSTVICYICYRFSQSPLSVVSFYSIYPTLFVNL